MRRALMFTAWIGLLASLSVGCSSAGDRVDQLRGAAGDAREAMGATGGSETADSAAADGDDEPFCLSLTRTAAAIASGSPVTAEEAAEEALALAPDALVDELRAITDALRDVNDGVGPGLPDEGLDDAVARIIGAARERCGAR